MNLFKTIFCIAVIIALLIILTTYICFRIVFYAPRKAEEISDELPVPEEIYPVIDNDLARDNIENDIPAADLEDLLPKARGGDWNGK